MTTIKVKLQLGDKIKMLARKPYTSVDELNKAVTQTYPKRLADKEFKLTYQDEDGEWINISDDDDTASFNEFAAEKKTKLFVKLTGEQDVEDAKQETAEVQEKVKFEDLKDFKIAEAMTEVEALLNSEDKFGPGKLFKAVMESAKGTKAEDHFKRIFKRLGKKFGKPGCGFRSPSEKKYNWKKHCKGEQDESSSPEKAFEYGGFGFGEIAHGEHGPHGGMRKHHGHGPRHGHGHGPRHGHGHGHGPSHGHDHGYGHEHGQNKKAMKFFKQFMTSFKDESTSSSEEVAEPKPVITNIPQDECMHQE
jgi:hypothetical protein